MLQWRLTISRSGKNSSLKEEIDKTEELTEKWSSLGDELQQSIDSANETTLDLKVNFDNVNELKEKLLEIIEDGKIDESEEAEYKRLLTCSAKRLTVLTVNGTI